MAYSIRWVYLLITAKYEKMTLSGTHKNPGGKRQVILQSRHPISKRPGEKDFGVLGEYRDGTSNLYKSMTRIQKRIAKRMLGKAKVIGVILLMMLIFTGNGYMVNQDTQYSIIAKS